MSWFINIGRMKLKNKKKKSIIRISMEILKLKGGLNISPNIKVTMLLKTMINWLKVVQKTITKKFKNTKISRQRLRNNDMLKKIKVEKLENL